MGAFISFCLGLSRNEKLPALRVVVSAEEAVFEIEYDSSDDESVDSLFSVQSEPVNIPVYGCPEMRRCISAY